MTLRVLPPPSDLKLSPFCAGCNVEVTRTEMWLFVKMQEGRGKTREEILAEVKGRDRQGRPAMTCLVCCRRAAINMRDDPSMDPELRAAGARLLGVLDAQLTVLERMGDSA